MSAKKPSKGGRQAPDQAQPQPQPQPDTEPAPPPAAPPRPTDLFGNPLPRSVFDRRAK